jgi:N6-adenosine-specific RNA methylase IME4
MQPIPYSVMQAMDARAISISICRDSGFFWVRVTRFHVQLIIRNLITISFPEPANLGKEREALG